MTEDREGEVPKPAEKRPVSGKLFAARRRMQAETRQVEIGPPKPEKIELSEAGTVLAAAVDYRRVDRADALLLGEAEELQAKLVADPDRQDAQELRFQIDALSQGVGREKHSASDTEARMYGLGFVQQRYLEKLPGGVRTLVERMEKPRNFADYMEASKALEPEIAKLGGELGDKKAREVRNLLERRRDVTRLIDHFDFVLSGRKSIQEHVTEALGRNAPEQTLRRIIANHFEDAWKWLGFSELRPTTMYSAARLRMERGEADPIALMAMKVEEERGKVEQGVEERLKAEGVVVEAPTTEEAGTAAAGAGEGVVEEALAQEVAGAEGEAAPAPEGAEGASEEETAEEAEERAAQEEAALPPAEQKALDDLEGLSRAGIVAGSQELIRRVQSGEIQTKTQFMQESARIVGLRLKLRESPEVEKPKVEKPEAREPKKEAEAPQAVRVKEVDTTEEEKRMEQEVDKRVEEEVASGSEWTKGKDFGKARKLVEELAAGTRSLSDLANELYPGKENRDKRVVFKDRFKQTLLAAGISKEEDVKGKSLTELWRMFTQAVDGAIEEDQRLRDRKEAKKARKKLFVLDALGGTGDYLKAAFMKGISEPGQSG